MHSTAHQHHMHSTDNLYHQVRLLWLSFTPRDIYTVGELHTTSALGGVYTHAHIHSLQRPQHPEVELQLCTSLGQAAAFTTSLGQAVAMYILGSSCSHAHPWVNLQPCHKPCSVSCPCLHRLSPAWRRHVHTCPTPPTHPPAHNYRPWTCKGHDMLHLQHLQEYACPNTKTEIDLHRHDLSYY